MTKFYSPSEVQDLTGVTPENLRDWRRRGLIDGLGVILTATGAGWTRDPHDPALADTKRAAWVYPRGDIAALATARQIQELGLDLTSALQIATQMTSMILIRAFPQWAQENYPPAHIEAAKTDFVLAIKGEDSLTLEGIALTAFTVVQISDFSKLPGWVTGKGLIINVKTVGSRWPAELRQLFEVR